jgi:hypothetical protein
MDKRSLRLMTTCYVVALSPLLVSSVLFIGEAVLTPGACLDVAGVMCWSAAVLILGWIYSIPLALVIGVIGVYWKKLMLLFN